MMDFTRVEYVVREHLNKTFPAAQLVICVCGNVVYENAFGFLDPETKTRNTNHATRFDLASVSKLFTVAAFMTFIEQGHVALDQRVCELLPEFVGARAIEPYPDPLKPGAFVEVVPAQPNPLAPFPAGEGEMGDKSVDANRITFRNLLAHNSGLPAWLPLWRLPTREARRATALACAFAYPTGARVIYSDIGLILVGFALEALDGKSLDALVRERITAPLGLDSIGYGPLPLDNVAPTEWYAHQNRRMCGEVHDENAWSFGGVAGHAGIFGNARDLATFGEALRTNRLLKRETLAEMTRLQTQDGAVRRGIGFVLWSPDPGAASHPLSEQSFGHTGFTGTSLWIDPTRELVIACLTNRVYYGRGNADAIMQFRVALHRTVVEIEDAASRG